MQNLERENANLKDKLDAEKKKTRVWFTWKCRSNKKTEKKLILFYQVLNFCGFWKFGFFLFSFFTKQDVYFLYL